MNPPAPAPGDFAQTMEPLLLILGGVMTIALVGLLIWLVRTMLREDRAAAERGDHEGGA